jgi:macrolide transport system ATP-binding/permease protein
MNDLKFAFRQLLKNPGFTAVAVLTLALGIGANTAIFSVVDQLLMRPLPVSDPQRLVLLGQSRGEGRVDFEFNYPLFRDYQRGNQVFSQLSATAEQAVGLGTGGATERQRALLVSGNYFSMLGVNAALGRTFAPNEGVEIDDAPVVVISHGLWQRRFGADPQVLNRGVTVNGRPFTIIGVAPREFAGTTRGFVPDLYVPITMLGQLSADRPGNEHPLNTRYFTWHWIMGRLKDGVAPEQAQAAMGLLAQQANAAALPNTSTNLVVLPGAQGFSDNLREARLPLNLLLGTAGLVLLIACANLANLQLARATGRTRDFAIRLALGAGRGRLVRGLLTESLLLSLAGGGLGLLVAVWLVDVLNQFRPPNADIELPSGLDPRALLFALAASVATGLLFGLVPAFRASRPQIVPELKGGGSTTEPRVGRWNLRSGLVVLQVSLSLVVLVSAGLCTRSLQKLQGIDAGFEPSKVVLASFDLGLNNYAAPQAKEFYDRLLERVRTLPGVEAAGLSLVTPLSGSAPGMSVERVEGYQAGPREHAVGEINFVDGDFFRALSVPLLRGRDFTAIDAANSPAVVVINDAFAQRYFSGQDPVGKRIFQHGPDGGTPTEVVGVVETTRSRRLTDQARPAMYFPLTQKPDRALTLSVRTGLDPAATISRLRELVTSLDPNVPIFRLRTLEQQKNGSLSLQRMAATLLGGFGLLALLLAALGIYGVLAYSVSRRTREIGVRMALGAQVADVLRLVLRQGFGLTGIGLLLGLGGAFAATRLLSGFLYEVQPFDPVTFFAVALLLALVAMVACWLPARRAARVHPMTALRNE